MSGPLHLRLLGGFRLAAGDEALATAESARVQALLALLVLRRDVAQARPALAFLLWPDSTDAQARTNLRHLLHHLRRALPDADRHVEITPHAVRWRPDAPASVDVVAFGDALDRGALEEAVDAYGGDLLPGHYDDWLAGERDRLRRRYVAALDELAARGEAAGDPGAVARCEALLEADPLHEASYRRLMRLHLARGDRARAVHAYHVCTATLERELGVAPSPETVAQYEALLPVPQPAPAGPARVPLVGREADWDRLVGEWRSAAAGTPRLAVVRGEPGVGKTFLVEELQAWCAQQGTAVAAARSYAAEGGLAYGILTAWLRAAGVRERLRDLDAGRRAALGLLLPELRDDPVTAAPLPADDARQVLFDAAAAAIARPDTPTLLVADDLQWGDEASIQFVHYLLRVEGPAPVLVAATVRAGEPGPAHPLGALLAGLATQGRLTEIELGRLSPEATTELAARLAGRPLPERAAAELFADTDGNPLFVVETIRAGLEPGGDGRSRVPARVQAVIAARLAELPEPAGSLVGAAAVVGREFRSDVLAGMLDWESAAVVAGLDDLWRRRIVREHGVAAYDFSHDRVREVAYETIGPARRRHLHAQAARAIERAHAGALGPVSGQIAHHHELAADAAQAIGWYELAAETAQSLHADAEAGRLLQRALELAAALPVGPGRRRRELRLVTALLAPLTATEGFGSPYVAAAQRRAVELADELGERPSPPVLRSLAIASLATGDFDGARSAGARLREYGERTGDGVVMVEADYALGVAAFWQGDFALAIAHLEAAVDAYRPGHRRTHLLRYGLDPSVVCLSRLGNALWITGRPGDAHRARDLALEQARSIGHPHTHATALVFAGVLAVDDGDLDGLGRVVAALTGGEVDVPAPHIALPAEAMGGYLDVAAGAVPAGLTRMRRAARDAAAGAYAPGMPAMLTRLLMAAEAGAGDTAAALATAERLLVMGGGAQVWEAEAHRVRAECLVAGGAPPAAVEEALRDAVRTAERQGALAFAARAAAAFPGRV